MPTPVQSGLDEERESGGNEVDDEGDESYTSSAEFAVAKLMVVTLY